jgi:hypothetical protein
VLLGASRAGTPDEGVVGKLDPPDVSFELHAGGGRRAQRAHDGPHDEEKGGKTADDGYSFGGVPRGAPQTASTSTAVGSSIAK